MNITKAKITKDNTLVATFKNENEDNVTVEGKNLIHKDLRAAFNELIPHLTFPVSYTHLTLPTKLCV